MALTAGTRHGVYEVSALIGEGGMGQVWQATDTQLGRQVALKILPDAFADDPDRLARFTREAQILASLNHPNIAAIYGIEEDEAEGRRALVLELVEGPTLADRISQGAIPIDDALPIAKQIAEALEAAHEAGVIHRDLKPANIKVRDDGTVKVLDFGLAKALDPSPDVDPSQSPTLTAAATQVGVLLGTAAYMSPEQAAGTSVDKRGDVWAFGVVLFEMLTGQRLFIGQTVSHVLASVLKTAPDWTLLPSDTPEPVRRLLRRSLEKERKRRMPDIVDALLEIEEIKETETIPGSISMVSSPAKGGWRQALPFALGMSAVAVVTTALAVWLATRATPTPAPVPTPIAVMLPAEIAREGAVGLAVSRDGRTIVFHGVRGPLYRRSLDQLDAVPIAGTGNVFEPFFSFDGEWVGYIDRGDNTLKKVRLEGGQPITLCPLGSVLRSASWGPDDTIVFSYLGTSGLWQVSADGGEVEPTHPGVRVDDGSGESTLRWVDLLPDGRAALASTGGLETESQVVVVSVDTGERHALFEGSTPRYAATGHIVYWREGALWAVPFDDIRREVTGSPTPVFDGVAFDALIGRANFAIGGSTLLYGREGQRGTSALVWVTRDGTGEEVVDAEPRDYRSVQLSPDGLRAAATITVDSDIQDVFTVDLARTMFTPLTLAPGADMWPTWSPDGLSIAFTRAQEGAFLKRADGTGEATPLTEPGVLTFITAFSPEGLAVVGRTDPETGLDIGLLSTDGGAIDWVLTEPFNETHAKVSPDGRWMAYVSEESGSAQVYVRPFPNVGDRRWPISRDGGLSPVWGPDSRELFFLAATNTETRVMAVDLETDQAFAAGNPRLLFSGPYRAPVPTTAPTWDISPEGERFLMLKDAVPTSTSTSTAVWLNWTEKLKRLMPTN